MKIESNILIDLVLWNDPQLAANEKKVREKYYKYTIERLIIIKNQNKK